MADFMPWMCQMWLISLSLDVDNGCAQVVDDVAGNEALLAVLGCC